ncbi:MAG TPA: DUF2380 domain-containing protein [Steroidobacteraceae bacterium]|nr:DUF2380 domain-containing protein [Steroidobacteraceae bacterium]
MTHSVAWSLLLTGLCLTPPGIRAAGTESTPPGISIAVIDFEYLDTSGEERDQREEHDARLGVFMAAVKRDLAAGDAYRVIDPVCSPSPCTMSDSTKDDVLAAARSAGAQLALSGGFHKMSTLVQFARTEVIEVASGRTVYSWLFTFRGDSDKAWAQAEPFMVRQVTAGIRAAYPGNVVPAVVAGAATESTLEGAMPRAETASP